MATLTDRPEQKKTPAQRQPAASPPKPPQDPLWTDGPSRPPEPNRRRDRLLACLRLFGPGVAVILGVVALVAVGLALALGGSGDAPATGAAQLVPGNALLYLHVSTDPSRGAVNRALTMSRRLPGSPLLFAAVTTRLDAMLGGSPNAPVSYASDVRPWLGKEAALAVLDTPGASAGTVLVLDVRNHRAARAFLSRTGAQPDGSFRGVPLFTQGDGTVLAFVRHYLVLGQTGSVEGAVYAADGMVPSLAASRQYQRAAAGEPADRVLDVYASADGVRRALAPRSGVLGDLGELLDQPALSATAISVSPAGGGLRVEVHSSLVPKLARHSQPAEFSPTLSGVLPAHSMLLLDAKGLRRSVPRLLGVATKAGILGRLAPLLSRLGGALAAQGVDPSQALGVFSGETAIALTPGAGGSGPSPVLVTRTAHVAATRAILANLEGPLTQVLSPPAGSPGQVPQVTDTTVAGVPVHELPLEPGFDLYYGVAHGLVVASTELSGITSVFRHAAAMSSTSSFQSAVANAPSRVTSLVFFDLSQLLRLGEQTGLIDSARQATLWPAVEKIHAVGLESWRGADDTTTQIQLQIP